MRRHGARKRRKRKIFFLLILNIVLLGGLFFGLLKIRSLLQEREFSERLSAIISSESKLDPADSQLQTGMSGRHYIQAAYPLVNSQPVAKVKELMLADAGGISQEKKPSKSVQSLTFYRWSEQGTSLANTKELLIQRTDYEVKNLKIRKSGEQQVGSIYLDSNGNPVTLQDLFHDADQAKQIFLEEIKSQLTIGQVTDAEQEAVVKALSEQDLSQWTFRFENGLFAIRVPIEIHGSHDLSLPLSNFYNQIKADYLTGADLEAYHQYEVKQHEKMVALTFDDGPDSKTTPQALEILKKYHVKATFFMVGQNVAANPDLAKRVHDEGHQIGIHTWSHPVLTKLPLNQAKKEITDTQEAIYQATGIRPLITRPPYGAVNAAVQNAVDQSFIMWSVDSLDWKSHNTKAIMQEVAKTQSGSIILMHDIHQTTIDALPSVIEYLKNNGYHLVTIDQLLEGQLQPHQVYYSRN